MIYEYSCKSCSHSWEEEQSIKDEPIEFCPSCNKKSAKRQISGSVNFILKGSGWYKDGYSSTAIESKK